MLRYLILNYIVDVYLRYYQQNEIYLYRILKNDHKKHVVLWYVIMAIIMINYF